MTLETKFENVFDAFRRRSTRKQLHFTFPQVISLTASVFFVLPYFSLSPATFNFTSSSWIFFLSWQTPLPKTSPPSPPGWFVPHETSNNTPTIFLLSICLSVCDLATLPLWFSSDPGSMWCCGRASSFRVMRQHEETRSNPWAVNLQWENRPRAPVLCQARLASPPGTSHSPVAISDLCKNQLTVTGNHQFSWLITKACANTQFVQIYTVLQHIASVQDMDPHYLREFLSICSLLQLQQTCPRHWGRTAHLLWLCQQAAATLARLSLPGSPLAQRAATKQQQP